MDPVMNRYLVITVEATTSLKDYVSAPSLSDAAAQFAALKFAENKGERLVFVQQLGQNAEDQHAYIKVKPPKPAWTTLIVA